MPRIWWLRDLIFLAVVVVIINAVWWALVYATQFYPALQYYSRIIVLIGINITLAVSLNIIAGHAGQFSLGHAGFMAIGAYTSAYLTYYHFQKIAGDNAVLQNAFLVVAVLGGGAMAAIAGYIVGLPSLRLRGDYLAIVTLGFGEIIRVIILNIEQLGAARGFTGVPAWSNFFWVFFLAAVTVIISKRLINSSVGRAFLAVREDEIAAEAMGVNTTRVKVNAFVISSALAGVAGGLFAHYLTYLNPDMFKFIRSFEVVVMVVLGGLGSITGSIIAAVLLTFLPEWLRDVKNYMPGNRDPRMLIYSVMLIALMLTRPQGLFGRKEVWQFLPKRKDATNKSKLRDSGPPVE